MIDWWRTQTFCSIDMVELSNDVLTAGRSDCEWRIFLILENSILFLKIKLSDLFWILICISHFNQITFALKADVIDCFNSPLSYWKRKREVFQTLLHTAALGFTGDAPGSTAVHWRASPVSRLHSSWSWLHCIGAVPVANVQLGGCSKHFIMLTIWKYTF